MIVAVTGGRAYANKAKVAEVMQGLVTEFGHFMVVHGDADGADALVADWADDNGRPAAAVRATWEAWGYSAGPRRNGWILKYLQPKLLIAFPGGRGTADMVRQARAAGIAVRVVADEQGHQ